MIVAAWAVNEPGNTTTSVASAAMTAPTSRRRFMNRMPSPDLRNLLKSFTLFEQNLLEARQRVQASS
jgi:hypothetical protein